MQVDILGSVGELDATVWDAIVPPGELLCTHRYLRAVEESGINDCRFHYPVVYDNGRLVAHGCAYAISSELDIFVRGPAKRLLAAVRRVWPRFLVFRAIECGTPVAMGTTISYAPGADRGAALAAMIDGLEAVARRERMPAVLLRDFFPSDLAFYDSLLGRGYTRAPNLSRALLVVRWRSFDGYLDSLRRKYRYRVKEHRRRLARPEVTVEFATRFAHLAEELAGLWRNVYDRAAEYRRERLTPEFFRRIDEGLGEESGVVLIRVGGRLVAFMLLLFSGPRMTSLYCGMDYALNEEYALYFNLFYESLLVGLGRGVEEFDLGPTSLETKKALGGVPQPVFVYLRYRSALGNAVIPRLFTALAPRDRTAPRRAFKTNGGLAHATQG